MNLFLFPSSRLFIHNTNPIDTEDLEKAEEREGWETIVLDGPDVRRTDFHNGRKVAGFQDTRHLLLHARSMVLALSGSGADARRYASLFSFISTRV